MSNLASKLGHIWRYVLQIWDFLRSVSIHSVPDLSYLGPIWPNLDAKFDIPGYYIWRSCCFTSEIICLFIGKLFIWQLEVLDYFTLAMNSINFIYLSEFYKLLSCQIIQKLERLFHKNIDSHFVKEGVI